MYSVKVQKANATVIFRIDSWAWQYKSMLSATQKGKTEDSKVLGSI